MHLPSIRKQCVLPRLDPDTKSSDQSPLVFRSLHAMGCRFELVLDQRDSKHDRYSIEAISDEMTDLIMDWHTRLTVFEPGSIVSQINRQPAGIPFRVDRELFELLRLCDRLRVDTGGAFNIASGTLMHQYGFRGSETTSHHTTMNLEQAFTLDTETMSITRSDEEVQLDFGAVAKGFVLDLIARELREYGIQHAFLHGGSSSSICIGDRFPESPWCVRLAQSPVIDARLRSLGLGVSEIDGRTIAQADGHSLGHIMDPVHGRPVQNTVQRVACTHPSAAIADAFSTALNVNPMLIDSLHEHGCSILLFDSAQTNNKPLIRDRLGVFTTSVN